MTVDAGGIATVRVGPWVAAEIERGAVLDEGAVHVWAFPVPEPRSGDRSPQATGSRHRSVRACVSAYTGGGVIRHDDRGRPWLDDLSVSVSSTRGFVLVALARGGAIGVDAEWVRPVSVEGPMRLLSPRERRLVGDDQSDRIHRVLRLWTRKEAWSKLVGRGIDWSWPDVTVTDTWPDVGIFDGASTDPPTHVVTLQSVETCEVALSVSDTAASVRTFIHR